jgi:hypothetical protein
MNYLIITFSCITALLNIWWVVKKKQLKNVALTLLAIAAAVVGIINQHYINMEKKHGRDAGAFDGTITSLRKKYVPILKIGTVALRFPDDVDGAPIHPYIEALDSLPLAFWVQGGKLHLSLPIIDSTGHMVAQISDNEWKVNTNLSFDHNYDDNGVEIMDLNNKVVFQASFDGDTVFTQFVLYKNTGSSRRVAAQSIDSDGNAVDGFAFEMEGPKHKIVNMIRPVFKYPSSLHPAERVSPVLKY